ncbi:MAG: DUF192 domain-containing protein [Elusimicrobiota bacterium]
MMMYALILSAIFSARSAPSAECKPQVVEKKASLTFPGGESITVDVVDTPATREKGLMCRRTLSKNYGMLFVFPREMALQFWMKNTLVSLDIMWIDSDRAITVIHPRLKASRLDTPESDIAAAGGRGLYVLELAAGEARRRGLKPGDRLAFKVAAALR